MVEQRKAWVTVMTEIRRAYFDVLAARQRMVLASAFFDLTHRAYERKFSSLRLAKQHRMSLCNCA